VFEEINRLSREVLIETKDVVQKLGYELIYADTDSVFIKRNKQKKNPLCRIASVDNIQEKNTKETINYDKEKYREMLLDAAETVLAYFGFDRTVYGNKKNIDARKWRWLNELKQEKEKDIDVEMI
jgi:DNA polymerase elongation subunit (family B)